MRVDNGSNAYVGLPAQDYGADLLRAGDKAAVANSSLARQASKSADTQGGKDEARLNEMLNSGVGASASGQSIIGALRQMLQALDGQSTLQKGANNAPLMARGVTNVTKPHAASHVIGAEKSAKAAQASVKGTDPAILKAIDHSPYNSPEELKKWDKMVEHLPVGERDQAARELNRPIAAAKMALEDEKSVEGQQAMTYMKANPALYRAMETRAGSSDKRHVMADGMHSTKDLKKFVKTMEDRRADADKMMSEYEEKNPTADAQSLSLVRSAAVMYANDPIARAADKMKAAGGNTQLDVKYTNIGDYQALSKPANNPDLSAQLTDSAKLWANPGMFNTLEDMGLRGKDVARHGGDRLVDKGDLASFIEHVAPKTGGEFADFIGYVAKQNSVANVDTKKLDEKVFDKPDQYTGAEKAAVLIRLQKMQDYVAAGRTIRNTDETEKQLTEKTTQLENDKDVQAFFEKGIKTSTREIIASSSELSQAVNQHITQEVLTGNSLQQSLVPVQDKDKDDNGVAPSLSSTQATQALSDYHDELQLYQDLSGNRLDVAQMVASRPDLAHEIRGASRELNNGAVLTQLASNKDNSVEQALDQHWTQVAFIDDALSKTAQGGIGLTDQNVVKSALQKANVDAQHVVISNPTLKSLMERSSDHLSNNYQLARVGGAGLLGELKDKAIKKGAKQLAKQGAKFATKMVAQLAGRAAAAVAGQAAGAALAGTISSAAGPVGWVAGAAMSLGFGIAELVNFFNDKAQKRRERRDFDRTVNPTLEQYGIAKPK